MAKEFRQLAEKCFRLAKQTSDQKTAKALRELAEEYHTKAKEIEEVGPA